MNHSDSSAENIEQVPVLIHRCELCRKDRWETNFICHNCVNGGQFTSSQCRKSSQEQQDSSTSILDPLPYKDRLMLLKKIQEEKQTLLTEITNRSTQWIKTRQISAEIQQGKERFQRIRQLLRKFEGQIDEKQNANASFQQRLQEHRSRIEQIENQSRLVEQRLNHRKQKILQRTDFLHHQVERLNVLRRQKIDVLYQYIFPIENVSTAEDDVILRMKDLSNAQRESTLTPDISDAMEMDFSIIVAYDRYRIVQARLPTNGDYQIDRHFSIPQMTEKDMNDPESLAYLVYHEFHEILSALSYACQLVNILSWLLHIELPFELHHQIFHRDQFSGETLLSNIAKLNTNIVTICLAQNLSIDVAQQKRTLENLCKLRTMETYQHQLKPVEYCQHYFFMLDGEMNQIQ